MGGKKEYINIFGSFTEPFKYCTHMRNRTEKGREIEGCQKLALQHKMTGSDEEL